MTTAPPPARPLPPPELRAAMEAFRDGRLSQSLELIDAALQSAGDRSPYLALAGLAAYRLGTPQRAAPYLEELLATRPDDGAVRMQLANAYVEMGLLDDAMGLVAGSPEPRLARVEGYVHQQQGRPAEAVAAYRRALAGNSNDASTWNNLGNVLAVLDEIEPAIDAFEHAITIEPVEWQTYLNLADVLMHADRHAPRLKVLRDALPYAPAEPLLLTELGMALAANDHIDEALEQLERAVALSPEFGSAHLELGLLYESLNRVDDLVALIARVEAGPTPPSEWNFLRAWQARREGRFDDAAQYAAQIPATIHPLRRQQLLADIAERQGDADGAFAAYSAMNQAALSASPPPSGPSYWAMVDADAASWSARWAGAWVDVCPDDGHRDPVFLVGFPRSGTTLLDTMLMGLADLDVLEEKPMLALTLPLVGDEPLPTMPAERVSALRAAYFGFAGDHGWDGKRWLVDKNPLNMARVPLIRRLFPDARVILAERHPYDVVLSCFMANFRLNTAMRSFSTLEEAARTYDAVFTAWTKATDLLPIAQYMIRYERLIADSETELRPLVAWLGEEWQDCLLDHQQIASGRERVRTASYSQIGEKLYTRARDRWRRYAGHLEPVLPILRPWAERMGYETV